MRRGSWAAELCGLDFLIGWTCKLWVAAAECLVHAFRVGSRVYEEVKGGFIILVSVLVC